MQKVYDSLEKQGDDANCTTESTWIQAAFKAKVFLEAVKGEQTIVQPFNELGVQSTKIRQWMQQLLEESSCLFLGRRRKQAKNEEGLRSGRFSCFVEV